MFKNKKQLRTLKLVPNPLSDDPMPIIVYYEKNVLKGHILLDHETSIEASTNFPYKWRITTKNNKGGKKGNV